MAGVCMSDLMIQKNGPGTDQYYLRTVNPPPHPGAKNAPMPQYFALRDQRRLVHVPRPQHFSPQYETAPAITFSVNGYPGVFMKDIWDGVVTVDTANDPVLGKLGLRSILVNFEWPGYNLGIPFHSEIDAHPDGRCITRQNLAIEICILLARLYQAVSRHRIKAGFEKMSLSNLQGVARTGVVLFSLHYYRNVWVPEFYVIE